MMNKDLRKLLKELEKQGFDPKRLDSGHWRVFNSSGELVTTIGGTPSDYRAWKNAIAALRRGGFIWPPKR